MEAQACAEKCAKIMLESDSATKHVGIRLDKIGPGFAKMSMKVDLHHLNGHNICHGGFIYDVRVVGSQNRVIAEMRGCSRKLDGKHFAEDEQ